MPAYNSGTVFVHAGDINELVFHTVVESLSLTGVRFAATAHHAPGDLVIASPSTADSEATNHVPPGPTFEATSNTGQANNVPQLAPGLNTSLTAENANCYNVLEVDNDRQPRNVVADSEDTDSTDDDEVLVIAVGKRSLSALGRSMFDGDHFSKRRRSL